MCLLLSHDGRGKGIPRQFCPAYFRLVEMVLKLVDSLVPTPCTAAMIASAMPAAIRPYSMAVAPDSSFTKRAIRFFIGRNSIGLLTGFWSHHRLPTAATTWPDLASENLRRSKSDHLNRPAIATYQRRVR